MFDRRFRFPAFLCMLMFVVFTFVGGCSSDDNTSPLDPGTNDQAPPMTPMGVGLAGQAVSKFFLTWAPNVDPDLAGYRIYLYDPSPDRNNAFRCVTGANLWQSNSFTYAGSNGVSYTFRITAVDASGNESAMSDPLTFHFSVTDTAEPGIADWTADNGRGTVAGAGGHNMPPYQDGEGRTEW
jgi:hypothetical protein